MSSEDAFNVGRFAVAPPARADGWLDVTRLCPDERRRVVDAAPCGTHIAAFGFQVRKAAAHVCTHELEALRGVGDALADAAVRAAQAHADADGAARTCPAASPLSTLDRVTLLAQAGNVDACAFMASATEQPLWLDWRRVSRGQRALRRHLTGYMLCLLNLSLIGGFGAPKINKVLAGTGYLTSNRERTWARLLETMQMFADSLREGSLRVNGKGWRSVCAVRLLHASVRVWLRGRGWDAHADGEPINQEDMMVTQLAFSLIPLLGLERVGLATGMSDADMDDILHLWKFIGHLSGIRTDAGLPKHAQDYMSSREGAMSMLASISLHIVEPDERSREIVMHVLDALAFRDPTPRSQAEHTALTRLFAGDAYADVLGLPRLADPSLADAVRSALARRDARDRTSGSCLGAAATRTCRTLTALMLHTVFYIASALMAVTALLTGTASMRSCGSPARGGAPVPQSQVQAEASAARILRPVRMFHLLASVPFLGDVLASRALHALDMLVIAHLGAPTTFTVKRRLPAANVPADVSKPRRAEL